MIATAVSRATPEQGGTGALFLVRFLLRRDRILLPVWMLLSVGVLIGSATAAETTYPTAETRGERYRQIQELPIFALFQSAAFDDSLPALAAQQSFGATTLVAGLGAMLLTIRHTRDEEQHGRRELLGSTPIGRTAPLAAALLVISTIGLIAGSLCAAALLSAGFPPAGSLLLGLVVAGAAWMGAGIGAISAQIAENARTAAVTGFVTIMLLHFVRGLGHTAGHGSEWITMLSPSGWLEGVRPYAGDRWAMLLVVAGFAALLAVAALVLSSRRDLGMGLLAARAGRESASSYLRDVFGLAWRQNKASFFAWAGGFAVIGVTFGSVGAEATAEYADTPWMIDYAETLRIADPAQAFFVYVVFVFVFPVAAYAVLTTLRLRAEEASGNAELLLSAPVARQRWAGANILAALIGSAALLLIFGLGLTLTSPEVNGLVALTVSLIPAVWVIIGVVVVVIGLAPRTAVGLAWAGIGVGIAGEILVKAGLPDIVYLATSPIAHVSPYYTTPHSWLVLLALAALTIALGLLGLRGRDLSR